MIQGYTERILLPLLIAIFFTLSVAIPKDKKDILKYARYICLFIAILITAYVLPGVHVEGPIAALVLAVILGAINIFLRPILVILTLPITIFSLGLFVLVINGLLVMLAAYIVPGFTVDNFWWAFLFGIVLAIVNAVLRMIENDKPVV